MAGIETLTKTEAMKLLVKAVRESQGRSKASWASSDRPSWWIDNHPIVLQNGSKVRTGIYDVAKKREWKVDNVRAGLLLYEAWKEDAKGAQRIVAVKKEDSTLLKNGKTEPLQSLSEGQSKREDSLFTDIPINSDRNDSLPADDESSERASLQSPSPAIRRGRTSKKKREQQLVTNGTFKATRSRRRKAVQAKTQAESTSTRTETSLQRKSEDHDYESENHLDTQATASRTPKIIRSESHVSVENDSSLPSDPKKQKTDHCQTSQRLSSAFNENKGRNSRVTPSTKAVHEIEEREDPPTSQVLRPVRNDPGNVVREQSSRNARISHFGDRVITSDKENKEPANAEESKQSSASSDEGRKSASHDTVPGKAPRKLGSKVATGTEDDADSEDAHLHKRRSVHRRLEELRARVEQVNAVRDGIIRDLAEEKTKLKGKCDEAQRCLVSELERKYKSGMLQFPKQIRDMTVAEFANEYKCDMDDWKLKDTERGVQRTLEAVERGEVAIDTGPAPSITAKAMSLRHELMKTARKEKRRIDNNPVTAGRTVRRSQRTAAKAATAKNRAIVSQSVLRRRRPKEVSEAVAAEGRSVSWEQMHAMFSEIRNDPNPLKRLEEYHRQVQAQASALHQ